MSVSFSGCLSFSVFLDMSGPLCDAASFSVWPFVCLIVRPSGCIGVSLCIHVALSVQPKCYTRNLIYWASRNFIRAPLLGIIKPDASANPDVICTPFVGLHVRL